MWNTGLIICLVGIAVITALLTFKYWGGFIYAATRHWQMATFLAAGALLGTFIVLKQQEFKYEIAYHYFTGTKNTGVLEARYQVRQCKEFIVAKRDGQPVEDHRNITAGFVKISSISNWEFCARTFALNHWKIDTSINGQDGGRLLCEAYARDSYRSNRVQSWCDTVFAPPRPAQAQQISLRM